MTIVCFVSGSGTNYREIAARDPDHRYLVFTNRPGCGGALIASGNKHEVVALSHVPYLKGTKQKYGPGGTPRNCPERIAFEKEIVRLIETGLGKAPDLICLAGYDQWLTDWMVDRYYPRILNVHPGDTTKGYEGLYWIPSAKAILAGDKTIRSTLFFVDKGKDSGPVLIQSEPLSILETLDKNKDALLEDYLKIAAFTESNGIKTYDGFQAQAGEALNTRMGAICSYLQDALKIAGDWQIYPFAVHALIAPGRVAIENRAVYVDGLKMSQYGYRKEQHS